MRVGDVKVTHLGWVADPKPSRQRQRRVVSAIFIDGLRSVGPPAKRYRDLSPQAVWDDLRLALSLAKQGKRWVNVDALA